MAGSRPSGARLQFCAPRRAGRDGGRRSDWLPLIAFTPSDAAGEPGAGRSWAGLDEFARRAVERLQAAAADSALMDLARRTIGAGKTTLAFLKQFPDAADAGLACYQGIVEADCELVALHSAGLTARPYRADIRSYASHPLEEQLGVRPGVQEIGHGIVANVDFTLGLGREVWRAG